MARPAGGEGAAGRALLALALAASLGAGCSTLLGDRPEPADGDSDADLDAPEPDAHEPGDADRTDGDEADAGSADGSAPDSEVPPCPLQVLVTLAAQADSVVSGYSSSLSQNLGASEVLNTRPDIPLYGVFQFALAANDEVRGFRLRLTRARAHPDCAPTEPHACPHEPGTMRLHALGRSFEEAQVTYVQSAEGSPWSVGRDGSDRGPVLSTAEVDEATEVLELEVLRAAGPAFPELSGTLTLLTDMDAGAFVACSKEHGACAGPELELLTCSDEGG